MLIASLFNWDLLPNKTNCKTFEFFICGVEHFKDAWFSLKEAMKYVKQNEYLFLSILNEYSCNK